MKHHQMLKRSTITTQPVLELTGVRCLTIPPGQLQYTRGSAELYDMFLEGLPTNILYDVLKPPTLMTYNALKDKV